MNRKDCILQMTNKEIFKKTIKSLSKSELLWYSYITVLVCIWFNKLGTHIAGLEDISKELLWTSIVSCAYLSILWYHLTEHKCYSPRILNFGMLISFCVFGAITFQAKEWWGQLICVLSVTSLVIFLINCRIWFKSKKVNKHSVAESFLLRDTPSTKDDYQRSSIVNTIVQSILDDADRANFTSLDGSFVFNINEPYGTGKTSCMEMLRKKLTKENVLYFDFLPWKSKSTSNLVGDFFTELKNTLSPYIYIKEKWYLKQYVNVIIKNAGDFGLDNWLHYDKGVNSHYAKFRYVLTNVIKRPIVIIVDDVDRLLSTELWGLLNLVRNVANFPYLYFVMNADVEYIEAMLSSDKMSKEKVNDYLKKIINVQILFPLVESRLLINYFNDRLLYTYHLCVCKNMTDCNEDKGFITASQLFEASQSCESVFDNYREVKRFFNSLSFSIMANLNASQNDKFLFGDYVKLEIIKYFAPEIYRALRNRPTELLDVKSNGRFVLKNECKEIVTRKLSREFDDLVDKRQDKNSSQEKIKGKETKEQKTIYGQITAKSEITIDLVNDMLSSLFYDEINYQYEKSIRYLNSYDMYFSNHQLPTYISLAKFLSIFYKRDSKSMNQINLINIESFYHNMRIMLQNKSDISDVKLFIESICFWVEYGTLLSKADTDRLFSEFAKIEIKFNNEVRYIWDFFDKDGKDARSNTDILLNFLKEDGLLFSKMAFVGQLFPLNERLVFDENDRKMIVENLSKQVIAKLDEFRQNDKNNCYDVVKCMWELDRYQVWANLFAKYLKSRIYNDWFLDCILYNQEKECYEVNKNNFNRIFYDKMIIKKLDPSIHGLAYLLCHEEKLCKVDESNYSILKKIKTKMQ